MTRRKFMNKTREGLKIDGQLAQFPDSHYRKGVWARYGAQKYYPAREWRLVILSRATREYGLRLNGEGGVAHDRHIDWLQDRGLITIRKGWHSNPFNGYRTDITYLMAMITDKGRKYLERNTK